MHFQSDNYYYKLHCIINIVILLLILLINYYQNFTTI